MHRTALSIDDFVFLYSTGYSNNTLWTNMLQLGKNDCVGIDRDNQDDFHTAHYLAGTSVADDGTTPDTYINRPSILLYSFTGGPQHMQPQFQDAMTIAGRHGKLNLFIEFTRSHKWQRQPSISLRANSR